MLYLSNLSIIFSPKYHEKLDLIIDILRFLSHQPTLFYFLSQFPYLTKVIYFFNALFVAATSLADHTSLFHTTLTAFTHSLSLLLSHFSSSLKFFFNSIQSLVFRKVSSFISLPCTVTSLNGKECFLSSQYVLFFCCASVMYLWLWLSL